MSDFPQFSAAEGRALARSYLRDPSDIPCPRCGPGRIEIVAFLDRPAMERGRAVKTTPSGAYRAIVYCHGCKRAAGLDLDADAFDAEDAS